MRKQIISVGMTTYNSGKYIEEQLDSIFAQSVKPDEIVICDDKSTDDTIDIIKGYIDRHNEIPIHLYENPKNIGYMRNFEKSFGLCNGDIIIPCDSDDVWCKDKVKRIADVFQNEEIVYVFHELSVTDEYLNVVKPFYYRDTSLSWDYKDPEKIIMRDIQRRGMPNGMSMAFRRSILNEITPFFVEHDGWIDICAPLFGKVEFIPEVLAFYRRHQGNLSGQRGGPIRSALEHTKQERFHMTPVLLEAYSVYLKRFGSKLSPQIRDELKRRILYERKLLNIVKAGRIKAAILLLGLYKRGYTEYRGSWKLLLADLINIVTHKN